MAGTGTSVKAMRTDRGRFTIPCVREPDATTTPGRLGVAGEIARERAAALGRIAGVLESLLESLAALAERARDAPAGERATIAREHAAVREQAERYRWFLVVQREANGLHDRGEVDRLYPIPPQLERAERAG